MKKHILIVCLFTLAFALTMPENLSAQTYTCSCPCNCPSAGAPYSGGAPIGDTRGAPVDMRGAPMTSSPSTPSYGAAPAGGTPVQSGYSDLPQGWAEPAVVPPGAVRIEDLGSPYGGGAAATGSAPVRTDPGAPASMPPPMEDFGSGETEEAPPPPSRWGS